MSTPDTYGRRGPAADIHDLHPEVPRFLLKQDRPHTQFDRDQEHLAAVEADIGRYIDGANQETAVPVETVEQLDLVAGLKLILKRLTYTQMKDVAGGILGMEVGAPPVATKAIGSPGEMADALEAWSSKEQAA